MSPNFVHSGVEGACKSLRTDLKQRFLIQIHGQVKLATSWLTQNQTKWY
jgi:hypothetical protein